MLLNYINPSIVKFCSHFFCASFTNEWQLFFKVVELQYQNISCVVRLHVICFTKFHSMTSWYLCFIHIRYDFCCNSILIFSWIPWTKGLLIIVVWNIFRSLLTLEIKHESYFLQCGVCTKYEQCLRCLMNKIWIYV